MLRHQRSTLRAPPGVIGLTCALLTGYLPKLEAELDFSRVSRLSKEEILCEAKDLYKRWPYLELDYKRCIIEAITEKIVIGRGEVSISLC